MEEGAAREVKTKTEEGKDIGDNAAAKEQFMDFRDALDKALHEKQMAKNQLSNLRWALSKPPSYVMFGLMFTMFFIILVVVGGVQHENTSRPLSWVAILMSLIIFGGFIARKM